MRRSKAVTGTRARSIRVLARAAARYGVHVVFYVVASTHVHLLLIVNDSEQMADFMEFMEYVGSNIARELGRVYEWEGSSVRWRKMMGESQSEAPHSLLSEWAGGGAFSPREKVGMREIDQRRRSYSHPETVIDAWPTRRASICPRI